MIKKIFESFTGSYLHRLLLFSVTSMGCALYFLFPLLTFKSQLTEVKGVIQNANASIKTVTEKSRGTKSQKSELIFYLFEKDQKFTLVKNIGNEYRDEEYQRILKDLKKADSVSVWVKKNETNLYQPKVFQIDVDNKTTLQFERVRTENGGLFLLLFFMGLSSLILYFSRLYPSEFKKMFRYTSQED